ncbi:hypothetical protein [Manganibacter manganicus]|uniref:Uncharacterized protein n=1 Tax=Manganibacter manganicus TaxID=1873176 RepID=A0A1V8RTJ9_9HYPH|nr:hypothetical protein [Pseudaminobacter manganicus]OQM76454.1 hypothetical protein BFN67_13790 [Pseudaminobacter manganicus]
MSVVPLKQKAQAETPRKTVERKLGEVYQPVNEREMAALVQQHERRKKAKPAPALKVSNEGKQEISFEHHDGTAAYTLLMEAMATSDADFAAGILAQIYNLSPQRGLPREADVNFARSIITGMEPRDQVETMLATQMAAIHMATITYARRVNMADNLPQLESYEKAMNRLARTFTAQIEALKRHRSKGEQRVYVERVDVREGGQAVVGNVSHGEGA